MKFSRELDCYHVDALIQRGLKLNNKELVFLKFEVSLDWNLSCEKRNEWKQYPGKKERRREGERESTHGLILMNE